ncbi:MAG: tetratricopeptide repeat protein [Candidatus Thorarchaeota archaeon]|nr:tetratricopeptide repeat protein [Candidatus Thorarchaeota archaeon]MCK5239707.1 tetratricopeptide repeat protein [Candidatus Thorarchaeota archaeon]
MGTEEKPDEKEGISYSDAMLEAARQSWDAEDLKKAESGYRLVIEESPDNLEAWTELCILLLQQRRETDAEKAGKQVLKIRGEKGHTWARLRGELRSKHVDKKTPRTSSTRSVKTKTDLIKTDVIAEEKPTDTKQPAPTKHLIKDTQKPPRRKTTQPVRSQKPRGSQERNADNWYEFGNLYLKQKKYPDAIRAFKKSIELEPRHLDAHLLLGQTLYDQEAYTEAISILQRLLVEDAENSRGWYLLGIAHLKLGKAWDASQALYECIKIDENHIDAWVNLGAALAKQGRHVQAQKAMRRALKHRRKDPDLLFEYAKSLKAEGKLARSENVLRMTVGVDPKSIKAWNLLGDVLMTLGKVSEARRVKGHARSIRSQSR